MPKGEMKMEIQKIDKNFAQQEVTAQDGKDTYCIPDPKFSLYGVNYSEEDGAFLRMPMAIAQTVSPGVAGLNGCTAGGRLRFGTDSKSLDLIVAAAIGRMQHMPASGSAGFTLCEETELGERLVASLMPTGADTAGYSATARLPGGSVRNYILHFPLYNAVRSLTLRLDAGATVTPGRAYLPPDPILYYGSSITQGGCASRAGSSYQAIIARHLNIDFINLGFSGNGKAEDAMVDYLRSIPCSIFVCDYDHNAPNAAYLKATHRRLYERYREKQPTTPILFLTRSDPERSDEGVQCRNVVRATYNAAVKNGDKNVRFLDGRRLFGDRDRDLCTVDGCHPNDLGFYRMACAIEKEIRKILAGK